MGKGALPAPEAVLFDLDGTLVDSMPLHFEAYRTVLAELDVSLDFAHFLASSGGPARETIPRLLQGKTVTMSSEEIHRRKITCADRLFREQKPIPLATAQILPALAARYPVGLVSSGSRRSVSLTLEVMGWDALFQVVVTGDDVEMGKPDPEGYLKAAQVLGVTPSACLVFEDMPDGIKAAQAAGMQVIDVRDSLPAWRRGEGAA